MEGIARHVCLPTDSGRWLTSYSPTSASQRSKNSRRISFVRRSKDVDHILLTTVLAEDQLVRVASGTLTSVQ
jgi:hypothetical protein